MYSCFALFFFIFIFGKPTFAWNAGDNSQKAGIAMTFHKGIVPFTRQSTSQIVQTRHLLQ